MNRLLSDVSNRRSPGNPVGSWLAMRVDALIFTVAGLCTTGTVLVVVDVDLAAVAAILGGMFTLAGLCILSFGVQDEGPLTMVPVARGLLVVAAVAGAAQTMVLLDRGNTILEAVAAPLIGFIGGAAVGFAIIALLRARQDHRVSAITLVGLVTISVSSLTTNGAALLGRFPLLSSPGGEGPGAALIHVAVVGSGIGELVIAYGLWRRPPRADL